ncbi:His Kinase A (phospho-acceptor) domain-containing protein [Ectothiorhodospira magna]|uniref:histidine kinase n=1 Tax=Ectothiorhodospira magna TaxID=867345 RepID=A0A1H9AQY0_9GAMM|nr:ATP-binding protein [Ectothiorhodospira magna]SEP79184.1 His Kinase A (phospho-acceptor) domain-containing protein [Ectothiorhodospira magna]
MAESTTNPMGEITASYTRLLLQVALSDDPLTTEQALIEAAALGQEMVNRELPLEEVSEVHHAALVALAKAHPELPLAIVADRVTAPLMEAYMAYSLAFREQVEQRTHAILTARLDQLRRLEAIGTLAAGVAHEFNNILGSIIGFSELLTDEIPADSSGARYLHHILQSSFRARDLTAGLLEFARTMPETPEPMDVVPAVRETIELLRATLPAHIRLELEGNPGPAWVMAEHNQIQQIIMNLCINAADAIQAREGLIRVGIDALTSTPECATPMIRLTVTDNGEGIPSELQARIFDPFFTTKPPGKGTGLGLSVIHGLVTGLGGHIGLESTPGVGTRFSIDLPALGGAGTPDTAQAPSP